ncbi:MAG: nitrous oxide reductase family maturation protein NosD [Isosphaeraceae bacterium]
MSLRRRNTRTRPSRQLRLEVEAVEGRTLLSTILVGPGGSIQAAVNAAKPGDTIKVAPGTYNENILIEKPVTLLGAQAGVNPITGLRTNPANESTIDGSIAVQSTSKVRIDGFSLNDSGQHFALVDFASQRDTIANNIILPGAQQGVELLNDNLATVSNNEIEGGGLFGINAGSTTKSALNDTVQGNEIFNALIGINLFQANGVVVKGNSVSDSGSFGLEVSQSTNVNAANNLLFANSGAVSFSSSAFNTLQGNTVEFNKFDGIDVEGDHGDVILANTVQGNATSGLGSAIVLDGVSGGEAVENNSVLNNHSNGIEVDVASPGVKVSGNTVENNGGDGIGLNFTSKSIIAANTVSNNAVGLHLVSGSKNKMIGNVVENNKGDGFLLDAKSTGNTVTENTALHNGVFDAEDDSTGTETAGTANLWTRNTIGKDNHGGGLGH